MINTKDKLEEQLITIVHNTIGNIMQILGRVEIDADSDKNIVAITNKSNNIFILILSNLKEE